MENRELDAWIAEHIMGYQWWFDVLSLEIMLERPDCGNWPEKHGFKKQDAKPTLYGKDKTDLSLFQPTTDSAAAMQVLEKIATKTTVVIYRGEKSGRWHLETEKLNSNDPVHSAFDMSLPLAIAKLAQQVFSDGAS